MKKDIHILMAEDDDADVALQSHALRKGQVSFHLRRVQTEDDFVRELEREPLDLIISDYSMPGFDGHTALNIAKVKRPETPFIFVTGTMGEEVAIETLKNGATDYVLKGRLSRLVPAVHRALREARAREERQRIEAQLRESHKQLRALSVYLQHVREEERTHIAREVHDELGQALTSCKLDAAWLARHLPRSQKELQWKAEKLSEDIDATIQTVRRIATELRPGVLDHLGLKAALEWQAQEFQMRTGIACRVGAEVEDPLDANLSTTFFRIFQETLTNVIRHAGATRVEVKLKEDDGRIVMDVRDNGRGISREEISNSRSMGLLGMRERATLLGGDFGIQAVRGGKGTKVHVAIPRHAKGHHEDSSRRRSRGRAARFETNSN